VAVPMTSLADGVRWRGWLLGLVLLGLVLILTTLPPFVETQVRVLLMQAFAPLCHQIAERSFHIDGVSLAVCHRCYGIYWGLFMGPFVYLMMRQWKVWIWTHSRLLVLGSLVPLGIDWSLNFLGLWHNTAISRLLTGGIFGLVAGQFVIQALASRAQKARDSDESAPVFVLDKESEGPV